MQKPSERHKLTLDNNIIKFQKSVHDPLIIKFHGKKNILNKKPWKAA